MSDARVLAFLVCDRADQDPESRKYTLHGVFNTVHAVLFPALHPALAVYVRLQSSDVSVPVQLAITTPSGRVDQTPALPFAVGPMGIAEGSVNLSGFPFPEPGEYVFSLLIEGRTAATYPIFVVERGTAVAPPEDVN